MGSMHSERLRRVDPLRCANPAFDLIDDAIANTTPGGTVNILDGTYTETVNVNSSVTLNGAQAGVDPNDGSWNDTAHCRCQ